MGVLIVKTNGFNDYEVERNTVATRPSGTGWLNTFDVTAQPPPRHESGGYWVHQHIYANKLVLEKHVVRPHTTRPRGSYSDNVRCTARHTRWVWLYFFGR